MRTIFFLCLLLNLSELVIAQEDASSEKSTYFLIRHAEKERSDETNKNPNLTEEGKKRALNWSNLLSSYGINTVYSTDYNRTMQTAQPTADKLGLEIKKYHPFKIDFDNFLKETNGKNVLVVGHSNTIPFFVNKLIKENKYQQLDDNDNSSLFIVTLEGESHAHVVIKTKS